MEECEALCNRLIIMVNGKICCIGSPQQLKNKFGKGYTVIVKVSAGTWDNKSDHHVSLTRRPSKIAWRQNSTVSNDIVLENNIKQVKAFMESSFPDCQLKSVHNNQLHFFLNHSNTQLLWAKIFGLIESEKQRLNIEDYSIGQTTLEQIFLTFAKNQINNTD
jgi:ATP-binding cassette, subfamily A (ABC1), member 3